jgi:hypothetical protein
MPTNRLVQTAHGGSEKTLEKTAEMFKYDTVEQGAL